MAKIFEKRFLLGVLWGAIALGALGGLLFFLIFPTMLKRHSPFPLEEELGNLMVRRAIPGSFKKLPNPVVEADSDQRAVGSSLFASSCSMCHGIKGNGESLLGQGMFPPAADLTGELAVRKTDGQLFWIVAKGLAFVGMPSFSEMLSPQETWLVVSRIRELQKQGAHGQAAAVPTGSDLEKGAQIFVDQDCSACHGENAEGDIGPALRATELSELRFLAQIRRGSTNMPSFGAYSLLDPDAELMYAWLKSLSAE